MPEPDVTNITPVLLTDTERRAIARSLTMTAMILDALDDPSGVASSMELAKRVWPEPGVA